MPPRIKRVFVVASAIAAVLLLLLTIVGGWRYDSWSFGRWTRVEVALGGGRAEFGVTRTYELSPAYRAGERKGQAEDFALDSTGRPLDPWQYFKPDGPIRHNGYYNGDGWAPRFDWATRLEIESFDGVNGSIVGPTDWTRSFDVSIPLLLLAGIAGLPAGISMMRRIAIGRMLRRARRGQCIGCGYDLRESPEQCPECGRVPREPRRASLLLPVLGAVCWLLSAYLMIATIGAATGVIEYGDTLISNRLEYTQWWDLEVRQGGLVFWRTDRGQPDDVDDLTRNLPEAFAWLDVGFGSRPRQEPDESSRWGSPAVFAVRVPVVALIGTLLLIGAWTVRTTRRRFTPQA